MSKTHPKVEQLNDELTMNDCQWMYAKNLKTLVITLAPDWQYSESRELKVTIKDVIEYYATQARNIVSGCRTLAGHTGDWRPIDNLAKECLEAFKIMSIEELRKEARKRGIEPRF